MNWQDLFWKLLAAVWDVSDIARAYDFTEIRVWNTLGIAGRFTMPRVRPPVVMRPYEARSKHWSKVWKIERPPLPEVAA